MVNQGPSVILHDCKYTEDKRIFLLHTFFPLAISRDSNNHLVQVAVCASLYKSFLERQLNHVSLTATDHDTQDALALTVSIVRAEKTLPELICMSIWFTSNPLTTPRHKIRSQTRTLGKQIIIKTPLFTATVK